MLDKIYHNKTALSVISMLLLSAPGTEIKAQDIQLRLSHTYPADHFLWSQAGARFATQISEETSGQVTIEVYSAGQLGKDTLGVMSSGLADIGFLIPSLLTDKLPLSEVTQLPNMFDSSCEGVALFRIAGTDDGILNQREYKPAGIKYLFSYVSPPYSMMTTKTPTPTLESLKGKKIRGVGGPMIETVDVLGAVPVSISSPEMYDSLSRGTIDGTIYSRMALKSLKLERSMKYSVDGVRLGTGNIFVGMSLDKWDQLPLDVQEAINRASVSVEQHLCKWVDEQEIEVSKELTESLGWEFVSLPEEEAQLWREKVDTVTRSWALQMDKAGLNGSEVLKSFLSAKAQQ